MRLLLTDEERTRVADWLECSADSNDRIAQHVEKRFRAVAELHRHEAAGMRVVAKKLRATSMMTVRR